MKLKKVNIGIGDARQSYRRFIDAWHKTETGNEIDVEIHLDFENLETLVSVLTPKRFELLRTLRQQGPLSVRALSKVLSRDYKNVYVDVTELEAVDLIHRDNEGLTIAPWDVIDAHVRLVA